MMSIPTGCPSARRRAGRGDVPVHSKTGMPNEEMTPFY